jgi:putative heme-binding domain-containing protein
MNLPILPPPNSIRRHLFRAAAILFSLAGFFTGPGQAKELQPIPDKLVVLTFDDGNKSDRTFVADVLKKHGFGATFYVTEGLGFLKNKERYLSWQDIRELHDMGFEIGNHTQHHENVARLSQERLTASVKHIDQRCIENGIPKTTTFCYPGYHHSLEAVRTLEGLGFLFARRGVGPEFPDGGEGARGPAYDPKSDHPLLIPTTGYAGPKWGFDDLKWAVEQARDSKICVLNFHGVPALEHRWVSASQADFARYMQYLKDEKCTVIAVRDLARYVDAAKRPQDPYAAINLRVQPPRDLVAKPVANPLGLTLNEFSLGWQPPAVGGKQTAFHVLVASDRQKLDAGVGDLWDSGWRQSAQNADVPYRGAALPAGAEVWWKVRIIADSGAAGAFSEASSIKTAALPPPPAPAKRSASAEDGEPKYIEGKTGKAIEFGPKAAMIRIPAYPELRPLDGTTVCAWIKPTVESKGKQTVFRIEDGGDRRFMAIGGAKGIWGLWFGLGIAGKYTEISAAYEPAKLIDGQWHHVAGTFDGKQMRLYIDGKKVGELEQPGKLAPGRPTAGSIGAYNGRNEPFNGGIDDMRVYTGALTEEQVAQLVAGKTEPVPEAVVGHWKLDGNLDNDADKKVAVAPDRPRNRVVFLGNTLISAMEKYGFLETALTARWPQHDLTFRNVGWPADDVLGTARSEFGSDQNTGSWQPPSAKQGFGFSVLMDHVADARPTSLIVGYGGEAAFAEGDAGFKRFQEGYEELLTALEKFGAKLILLAPPRHESFGPPMPDPAEANRRLQATSAWIGEVAKKRGHRFVELFDSLVARGPDERLTENGMHLNRLGYQRMAETVLRQLGLQEEGPNVAFGESGQVLQSSRARLSGVETTNRGVRFDLTNDTLPTLAWSTPARVVAAGDAALKIDGEVRLEAGAEDWSKGVAISAGPDLDQVEELRQLIVKKNELYRARLRPLNKTYIFLFRRHEMGHLAYEMDDFQRLAEEQEELIARLRVPRPHRYAIERIDAWKTPRNYPDHEVPKDIPTPDTDAELKAFTLAEGLEINLFAADPMIANPINMNWDSRGRLWVSTSTTYPHIKPGRPPNDRIVILEDTDQDGRADKHTVFAEGLLVPHSVMPVKGGAYVCSATELLFLADADGDDVSESRRAVFSGFGNADVHHMIHALRWAPWGDLHITQSIYINSFVETPHGPRRMNGSGIWRFRPETAQLDPLAVGMINPWGFAIDRWGQSFATDGAAGQGPHYVFPGVAFSRAVGAHRVLKGLIPGKPNNTGAEFISGRHFPDHWQGSIIGNDFRANRTVRYEMKENGSGYTAAEVETVLHSKHRSFRPVDIKMGPDGALYVVDWYNAIIDHGEVDFHHPLRDKSHGRIWRVTAKGRPLVERPKIHGAPIPDLLNMLKAPEQYTRTQANRELASRPTQELAKPVLDWIAALDTAHPDYEQHRLEGLWVLMTHRIEPPALVENILRSPDHRARAAAVRAVSNWRSEAGKIDRLGLLTKAVEDEHAQVRLEAVNALRGLGTLEAASAALRALDRERDDNLNFALELTVRALRNVWLPALETGKPVFDGNAARLNFALREVNDPRAVGRLLEIVQRGGLEGEQLANAARTVAALGTPEHLDALLALPSALLPAVAEGARSNAAKASQTARLIELLNGDAALAAAAAELCGRWGVSAAIDPLVKLLREKDLPSAAGALARLGAFEHLKAINTPNSIAAWASAQPAQALPAAIAKFSEPVVAAYLQHTEGPAVLAGGLANVKVPEALAIAATRLAQTSGRDVAPLIAALQTAGNLKPVGFQLTPDDRRALLADAAAKGNAARGREIYNRKELLCATCHTIDNQGGQLGPNLSTVGSYMTPESLLESLLNPSTAIKQGYETILLTTKDNAVVTGLLQRKTGDAHLLRDPAGNIVSIPNSNIAKIDTSSVSLMPPGLTASLRRDELIDLMRFLTSRGKKDEPAK